MNNKVELAAMSNRLRVKAHMIRAGEKIHAFSECDLMEQAAIRIEELEDFVKTQRWWLPWICSQIKTSDSIRRGFDNAITAAQALLTEYGRNPIAEHQIALESHLREQENALATLRQQLRQKDNEAAYYKDQSENLITMLEKDHLVEIKKQQEQQSELEAKLKAHYEADSIRLPEDIKKGSA